MDEPSDPMQPHDGPHDGYAEQLAAYALGALDRDERRALEAHLAAGCPECDRELAEWGLLLERMEEPVEPVEPSATTRARVLAAVALEAAPAAAAASAVESARRSAPRRGHPDRALPPPGRWTWLAAAASIAAVLLAGWATFRIGQVRGELRGELARADAERGRLAAELAAAQGELARARGDIARVTASLEIAGSPATRAVLLAGLPPTPGAAGTTLVDPRTRSALFYAHALPDPGPDKTYQLWYITDRGPISAGVFAVDAKGDGSLRIEGVADPARVVAWAVTLEPAGGVPQPTGEMVLKG